jgi:sugar O-acyltransferase (sialic acid O-acetyltransferase NeuD family)
MPYDSFIFGAGDLARVLLNYLQREDRAPVGFVVDDAWHKSESFCGLPLVPFSEMKDRFPPDRFFAYTAIGYGKMNLGRKEAILRLREVGYCLPNYIHPSVLNACASIGEGNLFFPGVILDAYTEIGDGNVFYPSVLIAHDCKVGSYNFFAPRSALAGDITVGDRCFFGLNSSVKNGLHIADRCFVGATAFAASDLPAGSVLAAPRSVLLDKDSETIIEKVMKK